MPLAGLILTTCWRTGTDGQSIAKVNLVTYCRNCLPQGGNHLSAKAVGNLVSVTVVNSLDDTLNPLFPQKHPLPKPPIRNFYTPPSEQRIGGEFSGGCTANCAMLAASFSQKLVVHTSQLPLVSVPVLFVVFPVRNQKRFMVA